MNTFFKISYVNWSLLFLSCCYLARSFFTNLNLLELFNLNFNLEKNTKLITKRNLKRNSKLNSTRSKLFAYSFLPCMLILSSFFLLNLDKRAVNKNPNPKGLDFLDTKYPGVKNAVNFLSKQEKGIVLEAQGPPYSETAMLATLTGFPAYLGWVNHVSLLMPDKLAQINKRIQLVDNVYSASYSCEELKDKLQTESIKYIIFGNLELKKYPNPNFEIYQCFHATIYSQGVYRIFQVS